MESKNNIKIVLALSIFNCIALFPMQQPTSQVPMLTVETNDGHRIEIPKNIADKSSVIANAVQDLGASDEPIPLPNISKDQLMLIIHILEQLDAADQSKLKRSAGAYIAQRIQPIIDQNLAGTCQQTAPVVHAAEYLDLGYIANGAIRTMIQKDLSSNPALTLDNLEIQCFGNQKIPHNLKPILEYQYQLVKNGDKELSIADYIAINGMPIINNGILNLSGKNLTSLEGLTLIPGLTNLQELNLDNNKLTTIQANAFNGLTNLQVLYLDNNKLTTIPVNAFNGLTNLQELYLFYNQLTTIPANAFNGLTNLQHLYLYNNQLTTIPVNTFNGLINLQYLKLDNNHLTTISANAFNGLTNLEELYISNNPITQTMNKNTFRNLHTIPTTTDILW